MAQLWGRTFHKRNRQNLYILQRIISFDQKFYEQDIRGSKAHVAMLARQGILTSEEKDQIEAGLDGILADVRSGKLEITSEYEDIHSFVEANLIDRIGDAGKKLHTGRSRNDQVALDMKLYVRDEIERDRRTGKETSRRHFRRSWKRMSHIHARLHTPPESAAGHTGSPRRCIL